MNTETPVAAISRRAAPIVPPKPNVIQRFNRKVRGALSWHPPDPLDLFRSEMPWSLGYALIPVVGQLGFAVYLACCAFIVGSAACYLALAKPTQFAIWAHKKLSATLYGPEDR